MVLGKWTEKMSSPCLIVTLPLCRSQWPVRSNAIPPEILKHWSPCICFLHSVGNYPGSHHVDSWTRYTDSPADTLWSKRLALLLWCWQSRDREGRGYLPCFFRGQRRVHQLNSCPWRFLGQLVVLKDDSESDREHFLLQWVHKHDFDSIVCLMD